LLRFSRKWSHIYIIYSILQHMYLVAKNQLNFNLLWIHWCYTIVVRKLIHTLSLQKSIINNKGNIFKYIYTFSFIIKLWIYNQLSINKLKHIFMTTGTRQKYECNSINEPPFHAITPKATLKQASILCLLAHPSQSH